MAFRKNENIPDNRKSKLVGDNPTQQVLSNMQQVFGNTQQRKGKKSIEKENKGHLRILVDCYVSKVCVCVWYKAFQFVLLMKICKVFLEDEMRTQCERNANAMRHEIDSNAIKERKGKDNKG